MTASVQPCDETTKAPSVRRCNVLMIYPRFQANTFWNFSEACKLVGARYTTPPLGLITVASLLPSHWSVRLVDLNTEDATDDDFAWADMVMTGGMIVQQIDTLRIIELAHRHGRPVAVGGPDATSSPHVYSSADFRVLGEAEDILARFVVAWDAGERSGDFVAEKFQVDMTKTQPPRFDLLKAANYLYLGVQFSRGCPFTCEFCDIIELYGRVPRAKTSQQMLAELQALYDLGYRGQVDFVDDNLIGNRKALRIFLPELVAWQEAHGFPFEFSTEASVNLADDHELLQLMRRANFVAVFVGIESPDPETLIHTKKKQNTRRDLADSIRKIHGAGIYVTAGFILGFDTEKGALADAMASLIDQAAIPVAMVGLLCAAPNTQLARRLEKEGRLHPGYEHMPPESGDQCTLGLNFTTLRPKRDILLDYRRVLEEIYDPAAYARRLERLVAQLDVSNRPAALAIGDRRRNLSLDFVYGIFNRVPEARDVFWKVFNDCRKNNPGAVRHILGLMAFYINLRSFSRFVIQDIDRRIETIDEPTPHLGAAVPATSVDAAQLSSH